MENFDTSAAWMAKDLMIDQSWVFKLTDNECTQLKEVTKKAFDPKRSLFDYSKSDFNLNPSFETIQTAANKAYFGPGLALVKGLPRNNMSPEEFELMVWAIGLHLGVARPQGKATQYISKVQATENNYRSANGRGYNSNTELDFHCDGCDLVGLACYNKAYHGGKSIISSSVSAWQTLVRERPDLAEIAREEFHFSRNQEEALGEMPYYTQPLFDFKDGRLFGKWNRNRVMNGQDLINVPKLTSTQNECMDLLDQILHRPTLMFTMWLNPGDLQFINNHVMLHSRTAFQDHKKLAQKRLLYRLWIATPKSFRLPSSWAEYFGSIEPGTIRGGIRGQKYDETCKTFEKVQAKCSGMQEP